MRLPRSLLAPSTNREDRAWTLANHLFCDSASHLKHPNLLRALHQTQAIHKVRGVDELDLRQGLTQSFIHRIRQRHLRQAAAIAGKPLEEIINRLRQETGQDKIMINDNKENHEGAPVWFKEAMIIQSFDAREMISSGDHPLDKIVKQKEEEKE